MVVQFMPAGLLGHAVVSGTLTEASIPVCHRPFPLWGSTGSKQTLNGLFLFRIPDPKKVQRFFCIALFSNRSQIERYVNIIL
jgi:hypothetical protein